MSAPDSETLALLEMGEGIGCGVRNYYGEVELSRVDGSWVLRLRGHLGHTSMRVVSHQFAMAWIAEFGP